MTEPETPDTPDTPGGRPAAGNAEVLQKIGSDYRAGAGSETPPEPEPPADAPAAE